MSGGGFFAFHDAGNKGFFGGDRSVIFVIVESCGVQAADFATAGYEPHPIAFDHRCTADALQRPVVYSAGDQFFAAVLPQEFACFFVERQQAPQVHIARVAFQVPRSVVGANKDAATGDHWVAIGLATQSGEPVDVDSFAFVPFARASIKLADVPTDRQACCCRRRCFARVFHPTEANLRQRLRCLLA